eukprot:TRINITY_DN2301_c0_g1_i1.p1 TRINITY_DN2301_c0_g1~~TRINITY_DN2301_c0_g1_i1.p1  ORF type:complete len:599 (-),score=76.52 TRINITY_DN2301_c0_g1_i1:22-1818(-)
MQLWASPDHTRVGLAIVGKDREGRQLPPTHAEAVMKALEMAFCERLPPPNPCRWKRVADRFIGAHEAFVVVQGHFSGDVGWNIDDMDACDLFELRDGIDRRVPQTTGKVVLLVDTCRATTLCENRDTAEPDDCQLDLDSRPLMCRNHIIACASDGETCSDNTFLWRLAHLLALHPFERALHLAAYGHGHTSERHRPPYLIFTSPNAAFPELTQPNRNAIAAVEAGLQPELPGLGWEATAQLCPFLVQCGGAHAAYCIPHHIVEMLADPSLGPLELGQHFSLALALVASVLRKQRQGAHEQGAAAPMKIDELEKLVQQRLACHVLSEMPGGPETISLGCQWAECPHNQRHALPCGAGLRQALTEMAEGHGLGFGYAESLVCLGRILQQHFDTLLPDAEDGQLAAVLEMLGEVLQAYVGSKFWYTQVASGLQRVIDADWRALHSHSRSRQPEAGPTATDAPLAVNTEEACPEVTLELYLSTSEDGDSAARVAAVVIRDATAAGSDMVKGMVRTGLEATALVRPDADGIFAGLCRLWENPSLARAVEGCKRLSIIPGDYVLSEAAISEVKRRLQPPGLASKLEVVVSVSVKEPCPLHSLQL